MTATTLKCCPCIATIVDRPQSALAPAEPGARHVVWRPTWPSPASRSPGSARGGSGLAREPVSIRTTASPRLATVGVSQASLTSVPPCRTGGGGASASPVARGAGSSPRARRIAQAELSASRWSSRPGAAMTCPGSTPAHHTVARRATCCCGWVHSMTAAGLRRMGVAWLRSAPRRDWPLPRWCPETLRTLVADLLPDGFALAPARRAVAQRHLRTGCPRYTCGVTAVDESTGCRCRCAG